MWKLTDIVGLNIDESDNLFLKVYTNIKSNKHSYVLSIQYKELGEVDFRFNSGGKNSNQVENFYRFLKANGSAITYDEAKKSYALVGKKLFEFDDAALHVLCEFEDNPITDDILKTLDASVSERSLEEILFSEFGDELSYMVMDC